MLKRAVEADEWVLFRDVILEFYVSENKPLADVMKLMKDQHGFNRTKAQYEKIFRDWKIKKYSSADVWKYIDHSLKKREAQGRNSSSIQIRGKLIPESTAKRQLKRHNFKTTFQRMENKYRDSSPPKTPPGVMVFTPLNSPLPCVVSQASPSCEVGHHMPTLVSSTSVPDYTIQVPWCDFIRFIERSNIRDTLVLQRNGTMPNPEPSIIFARDFILGEIFFSKHLDPESSLPPGKENRPTIDMTELLLSRDANSSQFEILKLAVHLMSNCLDEHRVAKAIVELAQNRETLALLRTLMEQKLLSMDASAEILFLHAAAVNNLPLMDILLRTGLDIDIRININECNEEDPGWPVQRTALQLAIIRNHEKLVGYLLDQGANPNNFSDFEPDIAGLPQDYDSLLALAVDHGNFEIIQNLLEDRPQFNEEKARVTFETLRIAVLRGNLNVVEVLIHKSSHLVPKIYKNPWLLLEPAAYSGSADMMDFLLNKGLQINATDESGLGSALAAAAVAGKMQMVQKILDSGANVDGLAYGLPLRFCPRDVSSIKSISALHGAILVGDNEMVRLLIDRGARMVRNHVWPWPIQLCFRYGDCKDDILDTLMEAGADVNAASFDLGWSHEHQADWNSPPARLALEYGDADIFDRLIEAGAEIPLDGTKENAWKFLQSAIKGRNPQLVIEIFDEFRCSPNFGELLMNPKMLRFAVWSKDENFVKMLLSKARSCHSEEFIEYGAAGLIESTVEDNIDMVKVFIDAGIGPHDRHWDNSVEDSEYLLLELGIFECLPPTAFTAAILGPSKAITELFNVSSQQPFDELRARKFAARDICGFAIREGEYELVTAWAYNDLENDCRYDTYGYSGRGSYSATGLALRHRRYQIAEHLLNFGVAPKDPEDEEHWTCLQKAAMDDQDGVVRQLIDLNVNVNAPPAFKRGATALQYAAMRGNFKIIKMLIKAGADVNACPGECDGRTAIEGAAEWGRLDMTRYLLEVGADMQGKTNRNYRRAVYRAWRNGHQTIVRTIQAWKKERYGADDCEDIRTIMETMLNSELHFANSGAIEKISEAQDLHGRRLRRVRRKLDRYSLTEDFGLTQILHEDTIEETDEDTDEGPETEGD